MRRRRLSQPLCVKTDGGILTLKQQITFQRQNLQESCELMNQNDFDAYLEAIEFLKDHQSPEPLKVLLLSLRDAEGGEIQYELIEACEAYPDELYVNTFCQLAPKLQAFAPQWADLMYHSILNSESCAKILKTTIVKLDQPERNTCIEWAEQIAISDRKHKSTVTALKNA